MVQFVISHCLMEQGRQALSVKSILLRSRVAMLFTECDIRHSVNAIVLMIQLLSVVDRTCAASFFKEELTKLVVWTVSWV